jgi:hypothetical protein
MPQSTAYRIGNFLGRLPNWVKVTAALAVAAWLLWPSGTTQVARDQSAATTAAASAKVAREAEEKERIRSDCQDSLERRRAEYKSLMKSSNYWEASLTLRSCAEALQIVDLKQLVKDAEIKSYLADLSDPSKSSGNRSLAFQRLSADYPDVAEKNERFAKQKIAEAERKEQEAERKQKRSQGVRLGMSKEDVLASSWGRPEKINTTTNVYGTREQWVYGGRNYLYFENGVLTSIQD